MSNGNFTNGSMVMKIWRFDGTSEIIAKFQYLSDAEFFAQKKLEADQSDGRNTDRSWFYLVICDYECKAKAFDVKERAA